MTCHRTSQPLSEYHVFGIAVQERYDRSEGVLDVFGLCLFSASGAGFLSEIPNVSIKALEYSALVLKGWRPRVSTRGLFVGWQGILYRILYQLTSQIDVSPSEADGARTRNHRIDSTPGQLTADLGNTNAENELQEKAVLSVGPSATICASGPDTPCPEMSAATFLHAWRKLAPSVQAEIAATWLPQPIQADIVKRSAPSS